MPAPIWLALGGALVRLSPWSTCRSSTGHLPTGRRIDRDELSARIRRAGDPDEFAAAVDTFLSELTAASTTPVSRCARGSHSVASGPGRSLRDP